MKKIILLLTLLIANLCIAQQGILTPVDRLKIKYPQSQPTATQLITRDATSNETGVIPKADVLNRTNHTGTQDVSTITGLTKSSVGLGNVDNTSDINKPISTASQAAIDLKANIASPTFTGTVNLPATTNIGAVSNTELNYVDGVTSGIQGQLNTKITANTSTNNYVPKVSGTNTFSNSRILDDGTYLGIGTSEAPTKTITLGNQNDKEIGIEESSNTVVGRNLTAKAGRAINYVQNSNFNTLNQTTRDWTGITERTPDGDVWAAAGGTFYKQIGGAGDFISTGITAPASTAQIASANGDIYVATNGQAYKIIGGTGSLVSLGAPTLNYVGICVTATNDIYLTTGYGQEVYKQTAGTGSFIKLTQPAMTYQHLTCTPSGDIYVAVLQGGIFKLTGGVGTFTSIYSNGGFWLGVAYAASTNSIYASTIANADIVKQTNLTGAFVSLDTRFSIGPIYVTNNGNVYAGQNQPGGDILKQTNYAVGSPNLSGGTLTLSAGTGKGTGSSKIQFITGQKTASGTDMQIETVRGVIDETGLMTLPTTTNALLTADLTGKAVVTTEYLQSVIPTNFEFNTTDKTMWNNGKNNINANTAFGEHNLKLATGNENTAFGYACLNNVTTGTGNSAIGTYANASLTIGSGNVAQGLFALGFNDTGYYNSALGSGSMRFVVGSGNTALGYDSGRLIGGGAGTNHTLSNNGLFLGTYSRALANNGTNEIVLGYDARGNGSNTVTIGNDAIIKTVLKGVINSAKTYTVAALPVGYLGDFTIVTDATSPTYLGFLTGGGTITCPVFYNGTAWVSH